MVIALQSVIIKHISLIIMYVCLKLKITPIVLCFIHKQMSYSMIDFQIKNVDK